MSFVRWSHEDFRSDVYSYEDVSAGYVTHVKGTKGGLPAGSFSDPSFAEMRARWVSLVERGYYVPPFVFDLTDDDGVNEADARILAEAASARLTTADDL